MNFRDIINKLKDPRAYRALFHELARQIHVRETIEEGISILNEKLKFLNWKEENLTIWEAMPTEVKVKILAKDTSDDFHISKMVAGYTKDLQVTEDIAKVHILEFPQGVVYIKEIKDDEIVARRVAFFSLYKLRKNAKSETK